MSTRRARLENRCPRCFMRPEVCVCPLVVEYPTRTRVVLLMHLRESLATTNTGRLASLALPNSEIRLRGVEGKPLDIADLVTPDRETWLLYPGQGAEELKVSGDRPVTLLVPDGTWRQAAKVGRREAALAGVRRVRLPEGGAPTRYRLRRPPKDYCLSTIEAIARALGILEGEEVQRGLESLFTEMVERTLSTRTEARRRP